MIKDFTGTTLLTSLLMQVKWQNYLKETWLKISQRQEMSNWVSCHISSPGYHCRSSWDWSRQTLMAVIAFLFLSKICINAITRCFSDYFVAFRSQSLSLIFFCHSSFLISYFIPLSFAFCFSISTFLTSCLEKFHTRLFSR